MECFLRKAILQVHLVDPVDQHRTHLWEDITLTTQMILPNGIFLFQMIQVGEDIIHIFGHQQWIFIISSIYVIELVYEFWINLLLLLLAMNMENILRILRWLNELTCNNIFCEWAIGSIWVIGLKPIALDATLSAAARSFSLAAASAALSLVNDFRVKLLSWRRIVVGFSGLLARVLVTVVNLAVCNVAVVPMRERVRRGNAAAAVPTAVVVDPVFAVVRSEVLRCSVLRNGTAPLQCVSTRGLIFFKSITGAGAAFASVTTLLEEFARDRVVFVWLNMVTDFVYEKHICMKTIEKKRAAKYFYSSNETKISRSKKYLPGFLETEGAEGTASIGQIAKSRALTADIAQCSLTNSQFCCNWSVMHGVLLQKESKKKGTKINYQHELSVSKIKCKCNERKKSLIPMDMHRCTFCHTVAMSYWRLWCAVGQTPQPPIYSIEQIDKNSNK